MSLRLVVLLALLGCGAPERTSTESTVGAAVAGREALSEASARLVRWLWQLVITGNPGGGTLWPGGWPGRFGGEGLVILGDPGGDTLRPGCGPGLVITGNPGGDTLRPWCGGGH